MKTKTRRLALLSVMTSAALVLSYIELLIPPVWSAVPGIKLGLPNIIIIVILYSFSINDAALVSFVRIGIVAVLFGNAMTFVYSIFGAALSLIVMALLKKTDSFSVVGVSIAGGVSHNLGQILAAMFLLKTMEIGYYMIILSFTGIIAGVCIGILGSILLKYFNKIKIQR